MSRIGRKTIEIPKGVTLNIGADTVSAKGPKGTLSMRRHEAIGIKQEGNELVFTRQSEEKPVKAAHGLMRALTMNLITGVTAGFERKLEINGVGYRAEARGNILFLTLGYSHPIAYQLPQGVTAKVDRQVVVTLEAADRELLGQTAAAVRRLRPPEPYKGKGVKYSDEKISLKEGKKK